MTQLKNPPKRIPITAAKRLAEQYLQDQIILITFDKSTGTTHVVTPWIEDKLRNFRKKVFIKGRQ